MMKNHVILEWSLTNFMTITLMWVVGLILFALALRVFTSFVGGTRSNDNEETTAGDYEQSEPDLPMAA
jgi:hypothetical protein